MCKRKAETETAVRVKKIKLCAINCAETGRRFVTGVQTDVCSYVVVNEMGEFWICDGQLHRDRDEPAVTWADGSKEWWKHGQRHRTNGPAIMRADGMRAWYIEGVKTNKYKPPRVIDVIESSPHIQMTLDDDDRPHSVDDKPAMVYRDGTRRWCSRGFTHRVDGPAVMWPDGKEEWHFWGEVHRADGPAVTNPDGSFAWYFSSNYHRGDDLPAVRKADGTLIWYTHGMVKREDNMPAIRYANGDRAYNFRSVRIDFASWCGIMDIVGYREPAMVQELDDAIKLARGL